MDNEIIRRARRSGVWLFDWLVWAWDSWISPLFMLVVVLNVLATTQEPSLNLTAVLWVLLVTWLAKMANSVVELIRRSAKQEDGGDQT